MDIFDSILKASQESDLVLLDANIFSEESRGEGLCERLYEARRPKSLEPLKEEISRLKDMWTWYHDNVTKNKKIKTTQPVLEEIKELAEIITQCYEWHSGFYGPEPTKNKKLKYSKREKILRSIARGRSLSRDDTPQVVKELGTLSTLMQETIRDIKVYNGNTIGIPRKYNNASDADYGLVEAAIGYVNSHPDDQAEIVSLDRHIPQILQGHLGKDNRWSTEYKN